MSAPLDAASVRALFDLDDGRSSCYLSCASRAPLLRASRAAAVAAVAAKSRPWEPGAALTSDDPAEAKALFAALIGAPGGAADIALTPSTSYAITTAAANVAARLMRDGPGGGPGDGPGGGGGGLAESKASGAASIEARRRRVDVLVLEDQMSSNVLPWQALVQRGRAAGSALRIVPYPDYGGGGAGGAGGAGGVASVAGAAGVGGGGWTAAVLRAMAEVPLVVSLVVAVPALHWADGALIDLVAVGDAVRARRKAQGNGGGGGGAGAGTALVVDATQAAGAMAMDVHRIGADFLACSVHKWLFGLYGFSFLYADPKYCGGGGGGGGGGGSDMAGPPHQQHTEPPPPPPRWASDELGGGAPLEHHSRNRFPHGGDDWDDGGGMVMPPTPVSSSSTSSSGGGSSSSSETGYPNGFFPGACRFDSGGRPNMHLLPALVVSLRQVTAWGPARIADALAPLAARLRARAEGMGFVVPSPCSNHIVGLRRPRVTARAVGAAATGGAARLPAVEWLVGRLEAEGVHVAARCGAIRVGMHLYNTAADVDRLCDLLARFIAEAAGPASRI